MALELNNLKRVDMPLNKETKPNQGEGEGATPFPGLLHFTLDPYLILLSVKQGGIKYHFFGGL